MPVALYLRVSTEEQRERQSIATQREFAERYCALHQLHVGAVFADDGVSGTVPLHLRPAAGRILPDARLHRFDQLLVYRLDRLGRDTEISKRLKAFCFNRLAENDIKGTHAQPCTPQLSAIRSIVNARFCEAMRGFTEFFAAPAQHNYLIGQQLEPLGDARKRGTLAFRALASDSLPPSC